MRSPARSGAVSRTARYMALFRAIETARPDRLFADPFAERFLTPGLRLIASASRIPPLGRAIERYMDWRWPGARSAGVARTRLIDDWIEQAIAAGARQVIVLGAGFDCRARRLAALASVPVYEVDLPALLAEKRRLLGGSGADARVIDVPINFQRDDLHDRLRHVGIPVGERALFLWEGVTNYLDADAVDAVLRAVVRLGGRRSRLIFTYVHADVLDGSFEAPGLKALFARLAASGERWTFGFRPEDLPRRLAGLGLRLVSDAGAEEVRRTVMGERATGLVGYEFYRAASAEVAEIGV